MGQVNPDQLLEFIKEGIQEIASTMLFIEITPADAEKFHFADPIDFVATIIFGDGLRGGLCLAAPESGALKLAETLLMENRQTMDEEMMDGFGELANMVAGGVQMRVEPTLGQVTIAPPSIVYGLDAEAPFDETYTLVSQYFEVEGQYFAVELYYLENTS